MGVRATTGPIWTEQIRSAKAKHTIDSISHVDSTTSRSEESQRNYNSVVKKHKPAAVLSDNYLLSGLYKIDFEGSITVNLARYEKWRVILDDSKHTHRVVFWLTCLASRLVIIR